MWTANSLSIYGGSRVWRWRRRWVWCTRRTIERVSMSYKGHDLDLRPRCAAPPRAGDEPRDAAWLEPRADRRRPGDARLLQRCVRPRPRPWRPRGAARAPAARADPRSGGVRPARGGRHPRRSASAGGDHGDGRRRVRPGPGHRGRARAHRRPFEDVLRRAAARPMPADRRRRCRTCCVRARSAGGHPAAGCKRPAAAHALARGDEPPAPVARPVRRSPGRADAGRRRRRARAPRRAGDGHPIARGQIGRRSAIEAKLDELGRAVAALAERPACRRTPRATWPTRCWQAKWPSGWHMPRPVCWTLQEQAEHDWAAAKQRQDAIELALRDAGRARSSEAAQEPGAGRRRHPRGPAQARRRPARC